MATRQMPDAGFHCGKLLRFAARTFREKHQDFSFGQHLMAARERIGGTRNFFPLHRYDPHHPQGKPSQKAVAEEIIRGGGGPHGKRLGKGKKRQQHQNVEVAVVIGDQNGRAFFWQTFALENGQPQPKQCDRVGEAGDKEEAEKTRHGRGGNFLRSVRPVAEEMEKERRGVGK